MLWWRDQNEGPKRQTSIEAEYPGCAGNWVSLYFQGINLLALGKNYIKQNHREIPLNYSGHKTCIKQHSKKSDCFEWIKREAKSRIAWWGEFLVFKEHNAMLPDIFLLKRGDSPRLKLYTWVQELPVSLRQFLFKKYEKSDMRVFEQGGRDNFGGDLGEVGQVQAS